MWGDHNRYLATYFRDFPGNYATHDEAVVDKDGHLWVLGRSDDVINVAGHRISTMEIEAAVATHSDVAETAVVGVPDATKGTVPVAFLTLRGDVDSNHVIQEIQALVTQQVGGYARLDTVLLTPALPKTRTGKIMRRLLRDVLVHGAPKGDTSAMDDLAALDAVVDVVASSKAGQTSEQSS